jgi:N-acetyl-anhydromuramyl-L-alanine amidase AmpD
MGLIIVRGDDVPCDAEVRTWIDTGYAFALPERRETHAIVNHWTGAENTADVLYTNLTRSRKSVHFAIDALGIVWQFCDAQAFCAHARGVNAWTVGIEIINRADAKVAARGVERALLLEEIHGQRVRYRAFTPEQTRSAVALNVSLCSAYGLPIAVPMVDSTVIAEQLPAHELDGYRGVLGHLHVNQKKRDPGLALLRAIHARGTALVS